MTIGIRIPQTDPRASYLAHRSEIDESWRRVMESGRYLSGSEVESFERDFAEYLNVPFAVATASGTDALYLALRALGVGPGDVVLAPSHTAVATIAAIVQCGARPQFVDIDPKSYTIDPSKFEEAIRRHRVRTKTKASDMLKVAVPVHLYGHPVDMHAIQEIAARYDLLLLEDCAQSHGAAIFGRKTGTWGQAAAFSFYPTKNLGALGDGGMIVTGDEALAISCRRLREYGWDENRLSRMPGVNSRLDELQAAILRAKLRFLDTDNALRCALANDYHRLFNDGRVIRPASLDGFAHVYHQYVIRVPRRDWLRHALRERGVETAIHYPCPVHWHPAFQQYASSDDGLVETDRAAGEILSLPMYPQLPGAAAQELAQLVNALVSSGEP
jgi:dTDP-4-amino-4,6-dideoxygalactose transaminase